MTQNFQVSGKDNAGRIYVIGGDTYDDWVRSIVAAGLDVDAILAGMKATLEPLAGDPVTDRAHQNLVQGGVVAPQQPQQAQPSYHNSQPAPVATAGGVEDMVDKYGNKYTFNLPTAPDCAHGPRAFKEWRDKKGMDRKAWVCAPKARDYRFENECPIQWAGGR